MRFHRNFHSDRESIYIHLKNNKIVINDNSPRWPTNIDEKTNAQKIIILLHIAQEENWGNEKLLQFIEKMLLKD